MRNVRPVSSPKEKRGFYTRYVTAQIIGVTIVVLILVFLRVVFDLPSNWFWGILIFWVAKDILIFPFVWNAYFKTPKPMENLMIGREGVVTETLNPSGEVKVGDEYWRAELYAGTESLKKGEKVKIRDVDGLTLIVESLNQKSKPKKRSASS